VIKNGLRNTRLLIRDDVEITLHNPHIASPKSPNTGWTSPCQRELHHAFHAPRPTHVGHSAAALLLLGLLGGQRLGGEQ